MQNLPDLEAWAIFARVATTGSFAKAAETLGMSQPTVSKAIIRLERRLGTTLLYRTSRRISLTPTGQLVMERAQHIVREGELIEAETSAHALAPKGLLRISAPMSFGLKYVAPLMPGFLARYPDVNLDVSFDDAVVDVMGGGFDVAIRIAAPEDSSMRAQSMRDTPRARRKPRVSRTARVHRSSSRNRRPYLSLLCESFDGAFVAFSTCVR